MRRPALILAPLAVALVLAQGAPSAKAAGCPNVSTKDIAGKHLRTFSGLTCHRAHLVVKRYFRKVVKNNQAPNSCAQQRFSEGCRIGAFRCYAQYISATRTTRGLCQGPQGGVRFREKDFGGY